MGEMVTSQSGRTLRLDLAQDLPIVEGDVTQVRQVVMNLITNASEPLPGGDYVFLEVADTGSGMDRETLQRIFDPFFTTKFTGRGLGMSSVLGILRGHRGTLHVASEVGRGSTFRVLLPVATELSATLVPQRGESGRPGPREPSARRGTVLVVDDELCVREVTARLGFEALLAEDGIVALGQLDALAAAGQPPPAAVLLDLTMPRMDGAMSLRRIRERHADLPVILCSGFDEDDAASLLSGDGHTSFLQKPFGLVALEEALGLLLGSEGAPAPDSNARSSRT